jgi:hypothetical protein
VAAGRGRRRAAGRILGRLGIAIAAYFGALLGVSLVSPARTLAVGQNDCSDDWCMAVTEAGPIRGPEGPAFQATFRLSSRAGRATQRELGVRVYLRDENGRRYDPEPSEDQPPFDVQLGPLQQVRTSRRFVVPAGARILDVVLTRAGLPFPGCCIIGDADSLLHRRTAVRLR